MQDLRLVIAKLMRDWGSDILLQRRIYTTGKGPYALPHPEDDEQYGGSSYGSTEYSGFPQGDDTYDKLVDESYYSNKLERWTVHYTMATRKTQIPDIMQGRMEGLSVSAPLIAYFTWDAAPTEGDRVYIKDDRFGAALTTWLVRYSEQVIGQHGKVAFYLCGMFREVTPANKYGQ